MGDNLDLSSSLVALNLARSPLPLAPLLDSTSGGLDLSGVLILDSKEVTRLPIENLSVLL